MFFLTLWAGVVYSGDEPLRCPFKYELSLYYFCYKLSCCLPRF